MNLFLQTLACFVFVSAVFGQGYQGRQRKPNVIPKKPLHTGEFDPFASRFDNGLDSLRRGGMFGMPEDIQRILGSTVNGGVMIGGMNGLPRHGGTLNSDGLVNGWGANINEPVIPAVQMWNDPLNGAAFPEDYSGQELVFDRRLNRYVIKPSASVGHQIAKDAHVVPNGHKSVKAEHNMVKQANHIDRKTLGGAIGGIGGPVGGMGAGPFGPTVNRLGTVNAGDITVDDPRVIAHNIGVATLGADAVAGHNIAKNSGTPVIRGFINPHGPVSSSIEHDMVKTSGVVANDPFGVGIDPLGQVAHGNMKVSNGRHIGVSNFGPLDNGIGMRPFGVMGKTADPVHNVDKVGHSGIAGIGHDPLAASLGHGIAKQAIGEAANVINMGSRGGLAAGDPLAIAATNGLVRESLNVADKTIAMASSGVGGHRGIGAGMSIFGQNAMIHPTPVKKPPPKFPTGYVGRRRQ